jgi:hypothetical protein
MFATIPFSNYQLDALYGIYHKCILYIQAIWNVMLFTAGDIYWRLKELCVHFHNLVLKSIVCLLFVFLAFEPTISASERLKTYASDHAATGSGVLKSISVTK